MESVREIIDHGGGAPIRQLLVVFARADGVGVTLDTEPVGDQRLVAQGLAQVVEDLGRLRREFGRAGRELNGQVDRQFLAGGCT